MMTKRAPDRRAICGISLAGLTTRLDPATIKRSEWLECQKDSSNSLRGRGFPKFTTLETSGPPQEQFFNPRDLSSDIHWTNLLIRSSKSFVLTPLSYLTYHERGPLSQKFISFYTFIRILQKSLEELVIIILGLYRSERKRR
jgi:hypothetical protein